MFAEGFLGTQAPLFMDVVTLYFAILPFLMGTAIFLAVKKMYELHYKLNMATFVLTLVVVVIFELGVRISGGFNAFMQDSSLSYGGVLTFLVIHILIALASVVLWSVLIFSAFREYKYNAAPIITAHKKVGQLVYAGMSVSSLMGVIIYYLLFIYK